MRHEALPYLLLGVTGSLSVLLTMLAYRGLPLSIGPVFESFSYVFVTLFGVLLFREKLGGRRLPALLLILAGILLYTL